MTHDELRRFADVVAARARLDPVHEGTPASAEVDAVLGTRVTGEAERRAGELLAAAWDDALPFPPEDFPLDAVARALHRLGRLDRADVRGLVAVGAGTPFLAHVLLTDATTDLRPARPWRVAWPWGDRETLAVPPELDDVLLVAGLGGFSDPLLERILDADPALTARVARALVADPAPRLLHHVADALDETDLFPLTERLIERGVAVVAEDSPLGRRLGASRRARLAQDVDARATSPTPSSESAASTASARALLRSLRGDSPIADHAGAVDALRRWTDRALVGGGFARDAHEDARLPLAVRAASYDVHREQKRSGRALARPRTDHPRLATLPNHISMHGTHRLRTHDPLWYATARLLPLDDPDPAADPA